MASPLANRQKIEHDHVGDEDSVEDVEISSWLFDEDAAEDSEVPSDRPTSYSESYYKYVKQCKESGGFDVDTIPEGSGLLGGIYPIPLDFARETIINSSKIALEVFNSKNEDENYEFVEVVKVNKQAVSGIMYYITFEAKAKDKDTCQTFQAKVWRHVNPMGYRVMLCRKRELMESGCLSCGCC